MMSSSVRRTRASSRSSISTLPSLANTTNTTANNDLSTSRSHTFGRSLKAAISEIAADDLKEQQRRFSSSGSRLWPSEIQTIEGLYEEFSPIESFAVLQKILSGVGITIPDEVLRDVCHNNDYEDGTTMTRDNLMGVMDELKGIHMAKVVDDVHEAFNALSEGSGAIQADDFRRIAKNFQLTVDVEKLLEEADEDGSGVIELDEFEKMIDLIGDVSAQATPMVQTPSDAGLELLLAKSRSILQTDTFSPSRNKGNANNKSGNPDVKSADEILRELGIRNAEMDSLLGSSQTTSLSSDDDDAANDLRRPSVFASMSQSRNSLRRKSTLVDGNGKPRRKNRRKRPPLTVVDSTSGEVKVINKLPELGGGAGISRLYGSTAPTWTVKYAEFMRK